MTTSFHKSLPILPFPLEESESDTESVFKFRSIGFYRTKSASPRISSISHFSSTPNLCALNHLEEVDSEVPSESNIPLVYCSTRPESPSTVITSSGSPRIVSHEAPARLNRYLELENYYNYNPILIFFRHPVLRDFSQFVQDRTL